MGPVNWLMDNDLHQMRRVIGEYDDDHSKEPRPETGGELGLQSLHLGELANRGGYGSRYLVEA